MKRYVNGRPRKLSQLSDTTQSEEGSNMENVAVATALVDKEGSTRGKNPRKITFKVLNQIPVDMKEFMSVTGIQSQTELTELLYEGYNSSSYAAASDEIGEFINDSWDKETQNQFRLAVRNYSKLTGGTIEDAVSLIKPGVEKGFVAKAEAAKAEAAKGETVTA